MSTLGIRLKRRARILAAGLTLSAATLAIIPGMAEAQNLGGAQNTNSADHTIGQVAVQDGVDLNSNTNASPNVSALSPGSNQKTSNSQSITGANNGGGWNTNSADHTVGQVAVQDGVDSNLNTNISPNVSVLSPGSKQKTYNRQGISGGAKKGHFGGGGWNTNSADHTIGQAAVQDGVNLSSNLNASPNVSALSPGSYQKTGNSQNISGGFGKKGGGAHNRNKADHTIGQIAVQDGVNLNSNANISPNVSVLSPGSKQKSYNRQSIDTSGGSGKGGARNENSAKNTIGQVAVQDGVDLNSNANVSPNASVLSPGSKQKTDNEQNISGSAKKGHFAGGKDGERNTNSARYTVGQAVLQDGVDSNLNANISPNASVLSPGSKQETNNRQNISNKESSGKGGGTRNDNSAKHAIGQVAVQDGVNLNSNANVSPNVAVLSPGSKQKTDNQQGIGASGTKGSGGTRNDNQADHSVGQVVGQDVLDLSSNLNASPNASVLSPGSYQKSSNNQNMSGGNKGGGKDSSGHNTNSARYTVGQAVLQDGVDSNINANSSPNVSVLSPDSYQETRNSQSIGGGHGKKGGAQNDNEADHTIGQVAVQDGVDLNSNANASPNVSVLSPGSKQKTDNFQSIKGGNNGGGGNTNSADHTIGQIVVQDGVDLNNNINASPNASVLSPGSKQKTENDQRISGDANGGARNDNSANHTIGQVVLQDGADLNNNTNLSPNTSVLSPGSEQKSDNCQRIGGGDCTAATSPGDGAGNPGGDDHPGGGPGDSPGDGPGDGNGPGDGASPDNVVPPPDDQPGDGSDNGGSGADEGGSGANNSGGSGGGTPSDGDAPTGDNIPDGRSPSVADVPEVETSRAIDSPVFITSPRAIEVPLAAAELGMADSAAIGGSTLPNASGVPASVPATPPAVLASSESVPQADGSSDAGITSLPETGGQKVWMVALGLLLLLGGLIAVRKLWRRGSPIGS